MSSKLVINSDAESRVVRLALKRAKGHLRSGQRLNSDYGIELDLKKIEVQIGVWKPQIEAWRRSCLILDSSDNDLRDLQHLVYFHMVRSNMSEHPMLQLARDGELKVHELLELLRDFGYHVNGISVGLKQVKPIVELVASQAEVQPATARVDPPAKQEPTSTLETRMREQFGSWVDNPGFMASFVVATQYARIAFDGSNYEQLRRHAEDCRQPGCMRARPLFIFALDEVVRERQSMKRLVPVTTAPLDHPRAHRLVILSGTVVSLVGGIALALERNGHPLEPDELALFVTFWGRM